MASGRGAENRSAAWKGDRQTSNRATVARQHCEARRVGEPGIWSAKQETKITRSRGEGAVIPRHARSSRCSSPFRIGVSLQSIQRRIQASAHPPDPEEIVTGLIVRSRRISVRLRPRNHNGDCYKLRSC